MRGDEIKNGIKFWVIKQMKWANAFIILKLRGKKRIYKDGKVRL